MDDLLNLDWSGNQQQSSNGSNLSASTSYLTGNKTSNTKKQDAFADLINFPSQNKSDVSTLPIGEQQRQQQLRQQSSQQQQQQNYQQRNASAPLPSHAWLSPSSTTSISPSLTPLSPKSASKVPSSKSNANTLDSLLNPFGKESKPVDVSSMPLHALKKTQEQGSPDGYFREAHYGQWNFDLLEMSGSNEHHSPSPSQSSDPFNMEPLTQTVQAVVTEVVEEDDNPLGILAGPAPSISSTMQSDLSESKQTSMDSPSQQDLTSRSSESPRSTRSPTPRVPDHDQVVAQLVEMGFSAEQAQFAVEATGGTGMQEALDLLVQQSNVDKPADREERPPSRRREPERQQRPKWDTDSSSSTPSFQIQKEKIMNQATELGGFLYKNASIFVKTGKERITKAVEGWQEQQRAEQLHRQQGRPRWMTQDMEAEADQDTNATVDRFVDAESSDEDPEIERQRERELKLKQEAQRRAYMEQQQRQKEKLVEEDVYISPSRRRATPQKRTPSQNTSRTPDKSQTKATRTAHAQGQSQPTNAPPASVNKRTRPIIQAMRDAMDRANIERQRGNEKYKLGQFGDAEAAYSAALAELPLGHDHAVLLRNNRAAARLKIGEYKQCIEDCDVAIEMAKASGDGSIQSEGVTIHWKDQIIKALQRKAEALENLERYKDAVKVYEELVRLGGSNNAQVNQGLARCRKAAAPPAERPPVKKQAPPQRSAMSDMNDIFDTNSSSSPSRSSASNVQDSKAVAAMRVKAAEQEAEEAEKLLKTDQVNERILMWKKGKEQNLMALLATLDTLLWPGAQWKGAQMSDLIQPKKCKIAYMKAISKVHPDKLPSTVTVEQRMLASSIFSVLNEAWDVFKAQNNLN